MSQVIDLFPADDFKAVCDNAARELESGIIIGYSAEGELTIFAGGRVDGKQPTAKDFLWMLSCASHGLVRGDYFGEAPSDDGED